MKVRGLLQSTSNSEGCDWRSEPKIVVAKSHHTYGGQQRTRAAPTQGVWRPPSTFPCVAAKWGWCGGIGTRLRPSRRPPARHRLRYVPEASLAESKVHEEPDEVWCEKKEGGVLPQGLHLLVADDGEVGNLGDVGPLAPSQTGGTPHWPRSCHTRDSHKILAALNRVSILRSTRRMSRLKGITRATKGQRVVCSEVGGGPSSGERPSKPSLEKAQRRPTQRPRCQLPPPPSPTSHGSRDVRISHGALHAPRHGGPRVGIGIPLGCATSALSSYLCLTTRRCTLKLLKIRAAASAENCV